MTLAVVSVFLGLLLWLLLIAPMHAREWDRERERLGLPPKRPPGLIGWRTRRRYEREGL